MRNYGTSSIGTLIEAKGKNQVKMELNAYFDQLMPTTTTVYFQVITDNMCMYISSLTFLRNKLCMLQDDLEIGSKPIYLESMHTRVRFYEEIIKEYMDTIAHYKVWDEFITKDHREEVDELVFPQLFES